MLPDGVSDERSLISLCSKCPSACPQNPIALNYKFEDLPKDLLIIQKVRLKLLY